MKPPPVISLSDLDWQTQEEIVATVKATPTLIPFACRMALTPARPWHTIFAHTPEEHACIAGMPGFSRVVGGPIQPAHSGSDSSSVAADNSFTVTPKFAIHQRVLVLKKWFLIEIKNYTFEVVGDPKKTGLTLLYVDGDGDKYYEDELRSNLDECRMCEELTVYKNECVVCGWEDRPARMPEEEFQHPSMSVAERNGHGMGWRK